MKYILNNFYVFTIVCLIVFTIAAQFPEILITIFLMFTAFFMFRMSWLMFRAIFLSFDETKDDTIIPKL